MTSSTLPTWSSIHSRGRPDVRRPSTKLRKKKWSTSASSTLSQWNKAFRPCPFLATLCIFARNIFLQQFQQVTVQGNPSCFQSCWNGSHIVSETRHDACVSHVCNMYVDVCMCIIYIYIHIIYGCFICLFIYLSIHLSIYLVYCK